MRRRGPRDRRRQAGASALEFAFVFPLFFAVFYGLVTYGMIFGVQHAMTAAAKDAARAAVACDPTVPPGDYDTCVTDRARATAGAALAWMPPNLKAIILGTDNQSVDVQTQVDATAGTMVEVHVEYPGYSTNPILPVIHLGSLGTVPPVPSRLAARAVAAL